MLTIEDLGVQFPLDVPLIGQPRRWLAAVQEVSFEVGSAECVGLVGESGCGKSTLAQAIVGLVRPTTGRILFDGVDLDSLSRPARREQRRKVQMVFQDPHGSLNPRMTIEESVAEGLWIHRLARPGSETRRLVADLLESVGMDPDRMACFPHEFSGGQRQRINIARALAVKPRMLVCDEPVSALDVSVQAQIINLLDDLRRARGMSYLFIGHDLGVVEHLADRVLVMYLGRIVESGPALEVIGRPLHPYTQVLTESVPSLASERAPELPESVQSSEPPSPVQPPTGCPFHPRCPVAEARCQEALPPLRTLTFGGGQPAREIACHRVEEWADGAAEQPN